MPKGVTPPRNIRIPNKLWDAVQRKAETEDLTASEVVRELLTRWVNE